MIVKKIIKITTICLSAIPFIASAEGLELGYLTGSLASLNSLFSTLIVVLIALAIVWFTWNVIKYVMSADEKGKEQAKSQMIWGIIALAVIVSVWGLVAVLRTIFSVDSDVAPEADINGLIPSLSSSGVTYYPDYGTEEACISAHLSWGLIGLGASGCIR